MQANRISPGGEGDGQPDNAKQDAQWQAEVLRLLLDEHPHQLTKLELSRELVGESPGYDQRDAVERAIRDLEKAGLLYRCEALVLLTKAARHFASLEVE